MTPVTAKNEVATVAEALRPIALKREGDRFMIDWSDGFRGAIPLRKLRDACPCATCNEKRQQPPNPLQVLSEIEVRAGAPTPVAMPPRGAYAYQIVWNDGHDTGIYTLELLRRLCERA